MGVKRSHWRITVAILIIVLLACRIDRSAKGHNAQQHSADTAGGSQQFPEGFEAGNKGAYAAGYVVLRTGTWYLQDALIGSSDRDQKHGKASVRLKGGGKIAMQFNIPGKVQEISIWHGVYGNDRDSRWSLWYSSDEGEHWRQVGKEVASGAFTSAHFSTAIAGPVRFEIRGTGAGRINIDDFSIAGDQGGAVAGVESGGAGMATRDDNMATGNPSGATSVESNSNNYLLVRPQYALSYNNSKGIANWVSWHLSTAWLGQVPRCNCFFGDNSLPAGYRQVLTSDYIGSGFSRGHLCPSRDRTASNADNAATFLMTNVSPQALLLNQHPWEDLESYCRKLASSGNELYIISGGYGSGGESSKGGIVKAIALGRISVPSHFWKIILVLPIGTDDMKRVTNATRVIAVDMPNVQSVDEHNWAFYRTSVSALERATGYDFLSNVSRDVQRVIESKVDNGPTR